MKFTGTFYNFVADGRYAHVRPEKGINLYANVHFPQVDAAAFADYKDGHKVEVTATVAEQPRDQYSHLMVQGKSIVRLSNPLSLVTAEGRKSPPLTFSVEKEQWDAIRWQLNVKDNKGKKVRGPALFESFERGVSYYKVTAKGLFHDAGDVELFCKDEPAAQQFLEQLKKGDEIVVEFTVVGGEGIRCRGMLVSMARISEPDKKQSFAPAKLD